MYISTFIFFFFQAEDGIRDKLVTGVQTCALPILAHHSDIFAAGVDIHGVHDWTARVGRAPWATGNADALRVGRESSPKIGRASCRERGVDLGGRRIIKKKKTIKEETTRNIEIKTH